MDALEDEIDASYRAAISQMETAHKERHLSMEKLHKDLQEQAKDTFGGTEYAKEARAYYEFES